MNMATKRKKCMLAILMSVCMAIVFCAGVIPRMEVRADDDNRIDIILDNIAGGYAAEAAGGKVELCATADGSFVEIDQFQNPSNTSHNNGKLQFSFSGYTELFLKLTANDGKSGAVLAPGIGNLDPVENTAWVYRLEAGKGYHVEFQNENNNNPPQGENPPAGSGMVVADLIINGTEFKDVTMGSTLAVGEDFDFSKQEITVTRLKIGANETSYTVEDHFGTGCMVDQNGTRDAFSLNGRYEGANFLKYGLEFHGDHPENTKRFPSFYIPSFKLVKPAFRGLVVKTAHVMDMIDFGSFNEVDLGEQKRGEILAYYGDDVITLEMDSCNTQTITNIEALGLPRGAVTIDLENKTVTVNSNYYDEVPLAVTLSDGKTNDFVIKRLGIEMHLYAPKDPDKINDERPLHGASGWGANFPDEYQSQYKLGAVFYHDRAFGYEDFQLVATLTYRDGTTETKVVDSYGERIPGAEEHESEMAARGCDYILWSGTARADAPVSASVTAVRKGALTLGSDFGGCAFGAGAGVAWVPDELREE